jgi:hypothetical protein
MVRVPLLLIAAAAIVEGHARLTHPHRIASHRVNIDAQYAVQRRDTLVRPRLVGAHRWRRLAEPCVYMLLFLTLAIVLPFAFPCRESGCVAMPDGGLVCKNDSAIAMDLYGAGDGRLRERAVEETMETFTCRQVRARVLAAGGTHGPPPRLARVHVVCITVWYSPLTDAPRAMRVLCAQQRTTAVPFMPPDETVVPSGNHTGRMPLPPDSAAAAAPLQRRYNELATLMHVTSASLWRARAGSRATRHGVRFSHWFVA